MNRKKIAIIGGGFSGMMTAVQLAARGGGKLEITLIEGYDAVGKGVAYSTRCRQHLLNVPAGRMSAFSDRPDHFLEWLEKQPEWAELDSEALAARFIPRLTYGHYLQSLLAGALDPKIGGALKILKAVVCDIAPRGRAYRVDLASGRCVDADIVVLAFGNFPPSELRSAGPALAGFGGYFRNPWDPDLPSRVAAREDLLLIGSGLTAVDVILSLRESGFAKRIYIVSRRGFLPRPHLLPAPPALEFGESLIGCGIRNIVREVREKVRSAAAAGIDWRSVLDGLRPHTSQIWAGLSPVEKKRFLRHVNAFWNVTRHRLAPEIDSFLSSEIASGRLELIAGRLGGSRFADGLLEAQVTGRDGPRSLAVGSVVNCTGPCANLARVDHELVRRMLARKLITIDSMELGIQCSAVGEVLDGARQPLAGLYCLGALRRGELWESVAVNELRSQAENLAELICAETSR